MTHYDYYIKAGDRLPALAAVLEDDNGPVALTGATVKWQMRLQGTTTPLKVDTAAVVVSAAEGAVRYDWAVIDTDTAGIYEGEWMVTFGDGKVMSFPNWRHIIVMVKGDV